MDALLFHNDKYQLRYNCSFYDYNTIPLESRTHPIIGALFVLTAFLFLVIYIPCMFIFLRKEYRNQPCYQLMFVLGVNDIALLLFSGVLTGVFGIFGIVYCQFPRAIYILGSLGVSLWCAQCSVLVILALNRCLEIGNRALSKKLFGKGRVFYWLLVSVAYFNVVCLWTAPGIFIPARVAWLFNPHDMYFEDPQIYYYNGVQFWNNIAMIVIMTTIYSTFMYILYKRSSLTLNLKQTKLSFIQVFAICLITVVICLAYIVIQYVKLPNEFVIIAQYIWICNSGFPALIYLTLNPTLRNHLCRAACGKRFTTNRKSIVTPVVPPPSIQFS